jgi:nicotinamide riboside kinase
MGMDNMEKKIKIALTGPESTGKSTLSRFLAHYFKGVYVAEFARTFLEQGDGIYAYEDVLVMAQGQLQAEKNAMIQAKANQLVIADTEWINYKIWLEYKKMDVPSWIIEGIEQADYALYLLMYPDLPWQADPLREYPDLRMYFFYRFQSELELYKKPYAIIRGAGKAREENAIEVINKVYF